MKCRKMHRLRAVAPTGLPRVQTCLCVCKAPVYLCRILPVSVTSSTYKLLTHNPWHPTYHLCGCLPLQQARASYYAPLARRLASWGVVVLQYNAPALTIIPDAAELPFLAVAVDWLKHAVAGTSAQPALQG